MTAAKIYDLRHLYVSKHHVYSALSPILWFWQCAMLRPPPLQQLNTYGAGYVCKQCRYQLARAAQRRQQHTNAQDNNPGNAVKATLGRRSRRDRAKSLWQRGQIRKLGAVTNDGSKTSTSLSASFRRHESEAGSLTSISPDVDIDKVQGKDEGGKHETNSEEETRRRFEAIMKDMEMDSISRVERDEDLQKSTSTQQDVGDEISRRTPTMSSSDIKETSAEPIASRPTDNGSRDRHRNGRSTVGEVTPRLSFAKRASRHPLSDLISQRQNAPSWGSFRGEEDRTARASYDTLRQADRKSPAPIVLTAGKQKSWGLEETRLDDPSERRGTTKAKSKRDVVEEDNDDGFGYSPAYLAEAGSVRPKVEDKLMKEGTSQDASQAPTRKPFGSWMLDSAKNLLGLSGNSADRPGYPVGDRSAQQDNGPQLKPETSENSRATSSGVAAEETSATEGSIKRQIKEAEASDGLTEAREEKAAATAEATETQARKAQSRADKARAKTRRAGRANTLAKGRSASVASVRRIRTNGTAVAEQVRLKKRNREAAAIRHAESVKANNPKAVDDGIDATAGEPNAKPLKADTESDIDKEEHHSPPVKKKDTGKFAKQPKSGKTAKQKHKDLAPGMTSNTTAAGDSALSELSSASSAAPLASEISTVEPTALSITALNVPQPPVPGLQYGLDRVLFNSGVYQLQDAHSRVYNFDPYLQTIMPVAEFDFNALKEYKTSSQDKALSALAKEHGKKYVGSTSSMTSTLGHFHYLLSNFRKINLGMLSRQFPFERADFTAINRAPNAVFLRYKPETKTYAIDADKEYDGANVLMMLGKSMEKLLTVPTEDFERYRKTTAEEDKITPREKDEPESFEYTAMGDFLMRSQLDAYDPRLPGTGMFDLKTRAVVSVRMDTAGFEDMHGYEIHTLQGSWESYEREYYDMLRSTMLKYMLQARMGRMDGIFVAYHNVQRIFGFQYLPMSEIDRAMHGQVDPTLGDSEFKASLKLMNEALEMATANFPGQSLRLHFETSPEPGEDNAMMWVFAEPMQDVEIDQIQSTGKAKIQQFERTMMGMEILPKSVLEDNAERTSATPDPTNEEETGIAASESKAKSADTTPTRPSDARSKEKHTSSTSAADSASSNDLAAKTEDFHKPLFAARIIVMNKVNGQPCEHNRPSRLTPKDKWEMEYLIREASDLDPAMRWARYEDCKTKRRELFKKYDEDDADEATANGKPSAKETRESSSFLKFLRDLSSKGRQFRGKIDEMEKGREKIVVGWPPAPAGVESSSTSKREGTQHEQDGAQDGQPDMGPLYRQRKAES